MGIGGEGRGMRWVMKTGGREREGRGDLLTVKRPREIEPMNLQTVAVVRDMFSRFQVWCASSERNLIMDDGRNLVIRWVEEDGEV